MGIVPTHESDLARFWEKVDQHGPVPEHCPELGPCWLWLAGLFGNGYGIFRLDRKLRRAHIVSYEWHVGPTSGLQVQHACNVRRCVNPSHLSLGDRERNMRYAASLGRLPRGERVHFAILTEAEAREVRRLASTGMPKKDIAIRYGISERTVRDIRNGRSWKHLL
jgi:hypothetical protein